MSVSKFNFLFSLLNSVARDFEAYAFKDDGDGHRLVTDKNHR